MPPLGHALLSFVAAACAGAQLREFRRRGRSLPWSLSLLLGAISLHHASTFLDHLSPDSGDRTALGIAVASAFGLSLRVGLPLRRRRRQPAPPPAPIDDHPGEE